MEKPRLNKKLVAALVEDLAISSIREMLGDDGIELPKSIHAQANGLVEAFVMDLKARTEYEQRYERL